MKEFFSAVLTVLIVGANGVLGEPTLQFGRESSSERSVLAIVGYSEWPSVQISSGLALPAQVFLIELREGEQAQDIRHQISNPSRLSEESVLRFQQEITAAESRYDASALAQTILNGSQAVFVESERVIEGNRYARVFIFPITIDSVGRTQINSEVTISVAERSISGSQLLSDMPQEVMTSRRLMSATGSTNTEYVIVTSQALAPSLEELARYRNETGHRTEIVAIEDIVARFPGRDNAERLRNYLMNFHTEGGKYVLLAGDESVLPVRYAYHQSNPLDTVVPIINQQICDLYFADLTGEWNRDGDPTWGERLEDAADLTAELVVGRLPFAAAEEFRTYTANLIRYETSPGDGNANYLSKAFFYSSDQMRDLNDGQHNRIAEVYPSTFACDMTSAVEATRGDDPSPSNLSPAELAPVLREGFGIVNIIAHGRVDGFVLKSAAYNEWPKTLMLTEGAVGHGQFSNVTSAGKPAFYYSLACDNAAFDADRSEIDIAGDNLCQTLLGLPDGAVGFVGYTRWGWVGTSYLLQKAYFDSLFAHPERSAAEAHFAAKTVYYYYRDMAYGLNYFGDPVMRVYDRIPGQLALTSEASSTGAILRVTSDNQPVAECLVVASCDGEIMATATTDASGVAVLGLPDTAAGLVTVSLVKAGYTVARGLVTGLITTDVEDDNNALPVTFAVEQNYPNPFNPSTTIPFNLPSREQVNLTVYNLLGQKVVTLLAEDMEPGQHTVVWNGRDSRGTSVGAGIYLYRIQAGELSQTKKMVLLP